MELRNACCSSTLSKQRTVAERPTPRWSHDTTSNRARSSGENSHSHLPRARNRSTPDAPGPPKFTNNEPIRFAGSVAGNLISARSIFAPYGWSWSSGTFAVEHWNPSWQSCQDRTGVCASSAASAAGASPTSSAAVNSIDLT
jgi:hypothetical protein